MLDFLRGCLSEESGKLSLSRTFAAFFGGIIVACWLVLGAWVVWSNWGLGPDQMVNVWERTGAGNWMTWGRDTMMISILPYLVNKGAGAVKGRGS